jgi:hypothetical protein
VQIITHAVTQHGFVFILPFNHSRIQGKKKQKYNQQPLRTKALSSGGAIVYSERRVNWLIRGRGYASSLMIWCFFNLVSLEKISSQTNPNSFSLACTAGLNRSDQENQVSAKLATGETRNTSQALHLRARTTHHHQSPAETYYHSVQ